jgi:PEP-CTERM putative exosortase interaction domain
MKKALALTLVLLTGVAFAESVNVYETSFESDEGFHVGSVANQVGWTLLFNELNQMVVTDDDAATGEYSLRMIHENGQGDVGCIKAFEYDNPYKADIIVSFMWRPSTAYMAVELQDKSGNPICDLFLRTGEINGNIPGYVVYNLNLDTTKWYPVTVRLDPKNNKVKEFLVDDNVVVSDRDYIEGASGDLGKLRIKSEWFYTTDSYMDDLSVDLVPEPASIGLLALLGLCFLRKRA